MTRWVANMLGIALIARCGLAAWGGFALNRHLIIAIDQWGTAAPDLKPTLDRTNATLDLVDRPCVSVDKNGHLLPDGPMCQFTQFLHALRKITTASGKQVQQTGELITATANNMNTVGDSVKQVAEHLNKTADAATGTLTEATATISEGKRTIAAAQPLLEAYTKSGNDLDALISENRAPIHGILVHGESMSVSADGMLVDAQWKTHQLLHPDKVKLGFWGATWSFAKYVHQFEPPLF